MRDVRQLVFGTMNIDWRLRLLLVALFVVLVGAALTRIPWTVVKRYPPAIGGQTHEFHKWEWIWAGEPRVWSDPRSALTVQRNWLGWIGTIIVVFVACFVVHALINAEVRAMRWNRSVCERCAYELRTDGSITCPECGHHRHGRLPRAEL